MSTNIQTCTTTTRPTTNLVAGDMRFETDTKTVIIWDGAYWTGYQPDSAGGWSGTNTYSMNFDGTDDRLNIAPITSSAQQGTVSAWIKTTNTSNQIIFTQTDTADTNNNTWFFLGMYGTGEIRIGFRNGPPLLKMKGSSTTLNDGDWHHVAWTSDGSTWKVYIDGEPESLVVDGAGNTTSLEGSWYGDLTVDICRIGCQERSDTIDSFFKGNIDEVAVWDSALTASQIDNIYHGLGSNANQSDRDAVAAGDEAPGDLSSFSPNHWWRMGDGLEAGSGSTVYDMSSNSVNATVLNATLGNTSPVYSADTP